MRGKGRPHKKLTVAQSHHRLNKARKTRANRHEVAMQKLERAGEVTHIMHLQPRTEEMKTWMREWLSVSHFKYVDMANQGEYKNEKRYNRERNEKYNRYPVNLFSKHYIFNWSEGTGHWPFPLLRPAFVHFIMQPQASKKFNDTVEELLELERDLSVEEQSNEEQMCTMLHIAPPNLTPYGVHSRITGENLQPGHE